MQRLLLGVDRLSTRIGQLFAWLIVALTGLITWEVLSRKFLDAPHAWAFDAQIMLYGILFMMAGATRSRRTVTCGATCSTASSPPRLQATHRPRPLRRSSSCPGSHRDGLGGLELREGVLAIREHSTITVDGPPIYPFKAFIPIAGALILLQGVVEIVRCVVALRKGAWPSRQQDVEEVDVEKLKEMVHVKDEDIAALDEVVVKQGARGGAAVRKELLFGLTLMGLLVLATIVIMPAPSQMTHGPPRAPHALARGRRDHARLPDRVHAHGHGRRSSPGSPTAR